MPPKRQAFERPLDIGTGRLPADAQQFIQILATSQAARDVERGLLLDVVVGDSPTIFQLLASSDQSHR